MAYLHRPSRRDDFEIAIICALPIERNAIEALLDEEYETDGFSYGKAAGDSNAYTTGRLGNQHVVLAYMPGMGMIRAAAVASNIRSSFERIKVGIVVGVCGGAPRTPDGVEILLGDVIISTSVIQIDFGRQYPNKFLRKDELEDTLGRANPEIRAFVEKASGNLVRGRLKEKTSLFCAQVCAKDGFCNSTYPGPENDKLYPSDYQHKHQKRDICTTCGDSQKQDDGVCEYALRSSCAELGCDDELLVERNRIQKAMGLSPDGRPITIASETEEAQKASIHFGRIACSNQVMKSGPHRDRIAADEGVIAFEMESAGTWDYIPTIVIKSVCDYADSHKNKRWQEYAAVTAAACTKALLEEWRTVDKPFQERPSSFVPFLRDPDFVDRGTLLDQIDEKCSAPASRTALVGLGGVGKSQLAIEYSYRIKERSPDMWVIWIHASSTARFEQSYRDIADQVKIPGLNNPKANIFKLLHDWLRDEKKGKCLLILDNVDDAHFLLEAQSISWEGEGSGSDSRNSRPLLTYLPQGQNASILITSRNKSAALQLVEERDIIAVEPMDEAHALALFEKKLGKQGDSSELTELAAALEFMPLAIAQSAAYISQRAPRCSIRQYIEKFQRSDRGKTTLLNHEGGHLRRDWEAKNSIIITWQISFDHILHKRSSAADLLSLMSFFDRQGIPEALIRNRTETDSNHGPLQEPNEESDDDDDRSESESNEKDEFEEDVLTLRNYSFISTNTDTATFEMHRLVQLAMRKWLEVHGQLERWKQIYIKNLCTEFPIGEYENWVKCQALFPHAKSAVEQRPDGGDSLKEWASLLYNAAWYAWRRGNVADAEKMSTKAMKVRKKMFGQEHVDTLYSMSIVASTYSNQGRWKEAEELEVQVMETTKRVLGVEHPDTITSLANLASTYRNQGRWKEAEELEVQVMETRKRVLGVEHPGTLTSMNNLAYTWEVQGRDNEALKLMEECVQLRNRVLGIDHPDTISSSKALNRWRRKSGIGATATGNKS